MGYLQHLVIDLTFLIQGNATAELPERLLGGIRFNHCDLGALPLVGKEHALKLGQDREKAARAASTGGGDPHWRHLHGRQGGEQGLKGEGERGDDDERTLCDGPDVAAGAHGGEDKDNDKERVDNFLYDLLTRKNLKARAKRKALDDKNTSRGEGAVEGGGGGHKGTAWKATSSASASASSASSCAATAGSSVCATRDLDVLL